MKEETYFATIVKSVFGKTNPQLCNWDTLQTASKNGNIKIDIPFHTNHFKSLIKNPHNKAFFFGLINIKLYLSLIIICYYLISNKDYYILLIIPISLFFKFLLLFFWHKRLISIIILISLIIISGKLLNLAEHYYWFTAFLVLITSMIHSVYNIFLTELFFESEENFIIAIDEQYISKIYDNVKGITHRGPFFMHKLGYDN